MPAAFSHSVASPSVYKCVHMFYVYVAVSWHNNKTVEVCNMLCISYGAKTGSPPSHKSRTGRRACSSSFARYARSTLHFIYASYNILARHGRWRCLRPSQLHARRVSLYLFLVNVVVVVVGVEENRCSGSRQSAFRVQKFRDSCGFSFDSRHDMTHSTRASAATTLQCHVGKCFCAIRGVRCCRHFTLTASSATMVRCLQWCILFACCATKIHYS